MVKTVIAMLTIISCMIPAELIKLVSVFPSFLCLTFMFHFRIRIEM